MATNAVSVSQFSLHLSFSFPRLSPTLRSSPILSSSRLTHPSRRTAPPLCATSAVHVTTPIISPNDNWATWTFLLSTATFGIYSERSTKFGKEVSGAIVSTLLGLAASSLGIVASDAPAYTVVMDYLLPLAVPLLMFNADLRKVFKTSGSLLVAFFLGSVATTIGTLVAYFLVPMRSLGQDSWKIATTLMSSYIGGAVNYAAVSDALQLSPSILAAGVAADNIICMMHFPTLFKLAADIPPETPISMNDKLAGMEPNKETTLSILQTATALAISFAICKFSTQTTRALGIQGGDLPCITAVTVTLATIFPGTFSRLAPTGDLVASILLQVLFSVIGASGNIWNVLNTTPGIFVFALIQVSVHLVVLLGSGKLLKIDKKLLLLSSNANIGGPTTACSMATAKRWNSFIVPAFLSGIFGIAISTFVSIAFGLFVLKKM